VFLVGAVFVITGVGYGMAMTRLRRGPARPEEMHLLAHSPDTAGPAAKE
jgi:hypothetical protein